MPVAIAVGAVFYKFFIVFSFLTPYLIFGMLFLTYCILQPEVKPDAVVPSAFVVDPDTGIR